MSNQIYEPFDFQPVIIIGAARSGTNMLRDALARLDGVATWPCDEINYIWRHYWASWPNDELQPAHATARARRFIRAAFCAQAQKTQPGWLVEKTCANSLRVEFVRTIVPQAKFIFLIRDGRDVVASAAKRWTAPVDFRYVAAKARYVPFTDAPYYAARYLGHRLRRLFSRERRLPTWGPRFDGIDLFAARHDTAEVAAEQWRRCVERAAESLAALPDRQLCTVRYEELVTRPVQELARVARFLGAPLDPQRLRAIAGGISADSVGKWRTELDAATQARIEARMRPTLENLGYLREHTFRLRQAA
jgi:hypothetical protein